MELTQLRYFQTVARLQHLTKAAEELGITQPALSKSISKLEDELGIVLFDRGSNTIRLNPAGEYFLGFVSPAVAEIDFGVESLQRRDSMSAGSVTFACPCPDLVEAGCRGFLEAYPQFSFRQRICPSEELELMLENHQADMCVASQPLEGNRVFWEPLAKDRLVLCVPAGSVLRQRASVSISELKDRRLIVSSSMVESTEQIAAACRRSGFSPRMSFQVSDSETALTLVREDRGVAFVSELWLKTLEPRRRDGLCILPIEGDPFSCELGFAKLKTHSFSQATRSFYDYMKRYFAGLVREEEL